MNITADIRSACKNYYGCIPKNAFESVGKSFTLGFVVRSLFTLDIDKGLFSGSVCAVSALIRALATPIFNAITPDPSTLNVLSLTLVNMGKTFTVLSLSFSLIGIFNLQLVMMIAATSAVSRTIIDPEIDKLVKEILNLPELKAWLNPSS